jgi:hypothetical protein
MHTFKITIQRRIERKIDRKLIIRWPVVVEWTASGLGLPSRREADLGLDPNQPVSPAMSPSESYGIALGRAVFHDGVRDAFVNALARATDCLHVLLHVEAEEWKALRWERLAAPFDDIWTPLARNERTPFAIHLPSVTPRRYDAITRDDLRALIVAASPILLPNEHLAPEDERWGLAPFDVIETVQGVRTALERRIELDFLTAAPLEPCKGPPTLKTLCNAISGQSYTFLHIVCHGAFIPADREPYLFLLKQAEHEAETAADVTY